MDMVRSIVRPRQLITRGMHNAKTAMDQRPSQPDAGGQTATVTNGLYAIRIEMSHGKEGRATGIVILLDGRILGGDSFFYYTGSYTFRNGKWRGEMIVHQHTEAPGLNLAFGGREVSCGFSGTYSGGEAQVDGTALVGKHSVSFQAQLSLREPI